MAAKVPLRRAGHRTQAARWLVPLAWLVLLATAGPARAQLFADDDARKAILELRTRFAQAEEQAKARQADTGEQLQTLRRSLLEMNNQLEAMRGEVAKLRGENEQLRRDVAELQKRQRDLGQALDDRLRRIEPQKVTVDGREFNAQVDETRQFDEAMALVRAAEFGQAVAAFDAFQKRWPGSGYGDAARFWRGNALYGQREYVPAIAAFRDFIARAPDSPRAPEAALAIANSQIEAKDPKAARRTLEDLVKAYPKSEAATAARERLTTLK